MNSNQRSQGNNQSDNGGNEKSVSSSRGGTVEKDNLNQSQQSGTLNGSTNVGSQQGSQRQDPIGSQQRGADSPESTGRTGSQTGNEQQARPQVNNKSNAAGESYPMSPATNSLSADRKMDEDTGLSNTVNQPRQVDQIRQEREHSNAGRKQ
ncbi:hypothetical protein KY495_15950 [Massilia sp. PAMC28688]|uniref:hypothetical protein n=1 Tax=Massilia sp. PAMC28688 TaxID=2861283 RepID=UPI001C62D444|nr:hypothetical protein [Massilia sp. PAMC28688]QYF92244.1 hypothetical protein KY495_15950 [Massilia sp. PAMC28688]